MLRVIVHSADCGAAANVGGPVHVSHRTFDIEAAALEEFLRDGRGVQYLHREVIGVEILPDVEPLGEEG